MHIVRGTPMIFTVALAKLDWTKSPVSVATTASVARMSALHITGRNPPPVWARSSVVQWVPSVLPFAYDREMEHFLRLMGTDGCNASMTYTRLVNLIEIMNFNNFDLFQISKGAVFAQLRETNLISSLSYTPTQIVLLIICVAWATEPLFRNRPAVTNAVYHGYRSWLEPTIFLQARFTFNARALIASGTLKVRFAKERFTAALTTATVERKTLCAAADRY
jgi:hypothetical protein